ncbi:DUF4352 domain-containing protein [Virgibacillus sp. 179-BFC.A HS]|uniref:DUF4352 domain-containing protein n=1 Tax=Tigheibacillus jepli TaxID=3035914 RepID=A0ABU5CD20_9BACI|nr:DUF4352 domain-containing protein [Virgibacillus sp. 179-BFC.A HS]MDY0404223.1 DUF4352 domain-containing protein [Virgibacillus sp. 179-BFC.A HS]
MAKEKIKKPFYKKWWVWLIVIIIIIGYGTSASDDEKDAADGDASAEHTEKTTDKAKTDHKKEKAEKKAYNIGDKVKVGKLTYTVKIEETNKLSNILGEKTTDGKFVIVEMTIQNNDKKARMADAAMFKIKTADGTEYSADAELDVYANEDGNGFFLEDINPNIAKTGKVVFELPASAKEYILEVSSGFGWSGGEYEKINMK